MIKMYVMAQTAIFLWRYHIKLYAYASWREASQYKVYIIYIRVEKIYLSIFLKFLTRVITKVVCITFNVTIVLK